MFVRLRRMINDRVGRIETNVCCNHGRDEAWSRDSGRLWEIELQQTSLNTQNLGKLPSRRGVHTLNAFLFSNQEPVQRQKSARYLLRTGLFRFCVRSSESRVGNPGTLQTPTILNPRCGRHCPTPSRRSARGTHNVEEDTEGKL